MIEDVDGTFDDYSISSKIRQILLRWFVMIYFFFSYKNKLLFF